MVQSFQGCQSLSSGLASQDSRHREFVLETLRLRTLLVVHVSLFDLLGGPRNLKEILTSFLLIRGVTSST